MKVLAGIALVCSIITSIAWATEISHAPLDDLWEAHMLAGTGATYYDGKEFVATDPPRQGSFESANGRPGTVWPTTKGIRVQDFRETRFWGLFRNGGWRMEGGLLARVTEGTATIELYGKSVWKIRPVLFHSGIAPPRSAEHSYEFFLLHRPSEQAKASVLKKWTIPSDKIPYDYYLRGALQYDAANRIATVKVTDVDDKRVFLEEPVNLSHLSTGGSGQRSPGLKNPRR